MSGTITNAAANYIDKYNLEKINECKKMVNFCDAEITYLENRLKEIKKIKKNCKSEIYNLCQHKWVIDRTYYDEHTSYYCCKCQSYQ